MPRPFERAPLWIASCLLAPLFTACSSSHSDQGLERDQEIFTAGLERMVDRAQRGDAAAQMELAARYYDGIGVEPNPARAANWYLAAAEQGLPEAQFSLGLLYETGDGVMQDPERAAEWYAKAARGGDARAQTNLGLMFAEGRGIQRDEPQALQYLMAAAKEGHGPAQLALASLLGRGRGIDADPVKAAAWLERAASGGLAEAQFRLAAAYRSGTGVPIDPGSSLRWLKRAAEAGHPGASAQLGVTLARTDPVAAAPYLQMAAEAGTPEAKYALALLTLRGGGVPQNDGEARRLFGEAADAGIREAWPRFAKMLEQGRGGPADKEKALLWYLIAARGGDSAAGIEADRLKLDVPPASRIRAQAMAEAWTAGRR